MRLTRSLVALAAAAAVLPFLPQASASAGTVSLTVLSGRADLVSGGTSLLEVSGTGLTGLRVDVGGKDQTRAFAVTGGHVLGLVTGLKVGTTTVTVRSPHGGARLALVNHPIGGPVFSGPQIQPWACQAGAKDAQCNAPTVTTYSYMPVGASSFQSYDPASPPPSPTIATTTSDTGVTVPFIVRKQTGYLDRDQFAIAELIQPGKAWTPVKPQPQFNHKLVLTHGASCDTSYNTATAPDVMNATFLGHGFVVASHALDNAGHNCNLATEAESLIMTKELVVKTLGSLRWTIGSGCSGGSLVQQQVANAYPGVYQAITPQCSFTDAWSSAMEYEDYYMLLKYFTDPSRWDVGTVWGPTQISAVLAHPNIGNPVTFTNVIPNSGDPSRSCPGVPSAKVYDKTKNPKGVKCTLEDYMVNVFGKRPDGFANRAFDNTGIQYGLDGLRTGALTVGQFVDLNAHVGGLDYSGDVSTNRVVGDALGLERAYRTGAVDSANNLDKVAIIDLRGPDPGAFHDVYRTYAMRNRLLRNFGTAANQVLWRGQVPLLGDASYVDQAVLAADGWVAAYTADKRHVPLAQKIREDKPGTLADRCTDGAGTDIPFEACDATVVPYGTPRFAADEPKTDDVLKCQLKPLRASDYAVTFSAPQWAQLKKAFPHGVCDYTRPGVSQHGATGWLTYQDSHGKVVYGGKPLGAAPTSTPLR